MLLRLTWIVIVLLSLSCASASKRGTGLLRGKASWYGRGFQGKKTASGERFDMHQLTAAHRTLPFGTLVRVREVQSGKEVLVRINDRGPYAAGRLIDLSYEAARQLGMVGSGEAEVELNVENSSP